MCCRGAGVACLGVGGPPAAWRASAAFAFAVALWMELAGRGGSEEEVEDVDEDEDEEEVVVMGAVGCAAMRAGAALWAAAASAAATAGRMEGISLGCGLGAAGSKGPALTWRPGVPIQSAAVSAFRVPLGWAPAMCDGVQSAGGNSSAAGGVGPGVSDVCVRGVWGTLGGVAVPWGFGLFAGGLCRLPGVGAVKSVRREGLWRACWVIWWLEEAAVVGPRAARDGRRV